MGDSAAGIPFGQNIPEDVLFASFSVVSVEPPLAPELSFRMALPNDWEQDAEVPMNPLEYNAFSEVAVFRAPADDLIFQVLATSIPFEICLADWLEHQARLNEFELLAAQAYETDCGQMVHGVARTADGMYLRLVVAGNGPSVVLCIGRAPAYPSEEAVETLGLAAATFEFTATGVESTREPVVAFTDRDRMFRVLYPQSWSHETLNRLRPQKAGVGFRISGDEDVLSYVRVEADTRYSTDPEGLEGVLGLTIEEIQQAGVSIQFLQAYTEAEGKPPDRWIGDCIFGGAQAQIALLLRPDTERWLTVIAFYPRKEDDPWSWMRGKRAYEIASATVESGVAASAAGASSSGFEIQ